MASRRGLVGAIAVIGSALLAGCFGSDSDGVSLAYYMRDQSDRAFEYEIASSQGVYAHGEVTKEPASTGCGTVPLDWELTVWPLEGDGGAARPAARLSAGQMGLADPVVVWVNITPLGQVQTGLGLPGWWGADIQRCP